MKFFATFINGSAFQGCIQPVWAENKDQAERLVKIEFDSRDINEIHSSQTGRTIMENRGFVPLDAIGVED